MKDGGLIEHYKYLEELKFSFKTSEELLDFFKANRPLSMCIKNNVLYYDCKLDGLEEQVFEIDIEESFGESDKWLYEKIVPIHLIFPNVSSGTISTEMSSFYICMVISSVLGSSFEEEFKEIDERGNKD